MNLINHRHNLKSLYIFTTILILISVAVAIVSDRTKALDVSWSARTPVVAFTEPISSPSVTIASDACRYNVHSVIVGSATTPAKICVISGENIHYGLYYAGGRWNSVVGLGYDQKMYKLQINCKGQNDCLYSPATDTLIMKQNLINNLVLSLVVYKNFTERLSPTIGNDGLTREYAFDLTNPDYIFQTSDGYAWPVGGMGISPNGRWLVAEFRGKGIGIFNLETFDMKRISAQKFNYDGGYKPTIEVAVTNNGRHAVLMGLNMAGPHIFDIPDWCGDRPSEDSFRNVAPMPAGTQCPKASIISSDFIYRFKDAYTPHLSEDGSSLRFYATTYDKTVTPPIEVELRAQGYRESRLDYLALGDSFTSGEGETSDKYYQYGTNARYEKCHTSSNSYPYVVADLAGIDRSNVKNVACSGAITADIVGDDSSYWGQGNRLFSTGLNMTLSEKMLAQSFALDSFTPGRIRQTSFVREYQPKVITVSVGGNDAGFMQKLKTCLNPGTCSWAGTDQGRAQTANEIKGLFNIFMQTYQTIHDASPGSKIYAIGYPRIIDEHGTCDALMATLLSPAEKQFMNEGIKYLNEVISAAASTTGIGYVDIWESYGDRTLCSNYAPSAMNGIKLGDDSSLIEALGGLKIIGQESFHPKPLGHLLTAEKIINSIGDITTHDYCENGNVLCPKGTSVPEPSPYWASSQNQKYVTQKYTNYASVEATREGKVQMLLSLMSRSLASGSSAFLEVHSTPTLLGEFEIDEMGGLNTALELPDNLDYGYHTLHLYGTSYSGEELDLYQIIEHSPPPATAPEATPESDDTAGPSSDSSASLFSPASSIAYAPVITNSETDQATPQIRQMPNVKGAITNSASQVAVIGSNKIQEQAVVKSKNNTVLIIVVILVSTGVLALLGAKLANRH